VVNVAGGADDDSFHINCGMRIVDCGIIGGAVYRKRSENPKPARTRNSQSAMSNPPGLLIAAAL